VVAKVVGRLRTGDLLLVLGAGDITQVASETLAALGREPGAS
jgi:UDP-N-acetylmuramate-alanine ligase